MNIPNAPYYAWYIYVKFSDHAELPPELCAQSNTVGEKVFTGREITPQIIELLVSQVSMGMVVQLYISPFMPVDHYEAAERIELIHQLEDFGFTHGCSAAVMNQEQSTAVFLWLNEYILNHHMHIPLRADDRKLLQTPVLFESYRDMAETVLRVILTGRLDGSGTQPPAVSAVRRGVDPGLLFWIENVYGMVPESMEDLVEVELAGLSDEYYVRRYPKFPDWLAPEPGNWSLLGELPNLEVLCMPKVRLENYDFLRSCRKLGVLNLSRTNLSASYALENLSQVTILDLPPADFDDFSFLLKCRSLEIVDLSHTNFRDCAILAQMPELKMVFLPAERQLLHRELLDPLPIQVKTNPRCIRGDGFPSYELVKPQPVESWDWKPPYTVLYIAYYDINDEEKTWQGREITQKVVEKLMKKIRKKKLDELYLSLQYWGEEEDMTLCISGEGVCVNFFDKEQKINYSLFDPNHPVDWDRLPHQVSDQEDSDFGEYATDNLELAADCVAYFIKTGKLYPWTYWAKYYNWEKQEDN